MIGRWIRLSAAVLLLGLSGCGSGATPAAPGGTTAAAAPPPSTSPFPPRPVELRLDGVDPCALLNTAQQGQLGVRKVGQYADSDGMGSAACQWSNSGDKPDQLLLARLIIRQGADYALGSTTGVQVVQVGGFSAVQTAAPYQDPKTNCVVVVDVAQGQSLGVQFQNVAGDYPGINHDVACQLDRKAAELMVQNLRALAH